MNHIKAMQLAMDHLMNLQPILGNGLLEERQLAFIDPHIDCAMTALQEGLAEQPAPVQQEPGVKGYAMALNEIALKLRQRYKTDLLATPLWADFEKARNKFAASIATPQPAQQEPPAWWPAVENILKEHGLQAIDFVADFKAALAEQPAPVQGWKLVPVEPTMKMIAALGFDGDVDMAIGHAAISKGIEDAYTAMLAAAPQLAQQQEPVAWIRWEWNRSGLRTLVFSKPTELPLAEEATGVVYDPLYTSPQPAQRNPLTLWTDAQHERAYRNSPELHKDVKSLSAFKRVAKEIAAMYGIKENT